MKKHLFFFLLILVCNILFQRTSMLLILNFYNSREVIDNGVQEIYINARVNDGSKIAQLMQYMKCTKGEHPLFPRISARVKYLKEDQKGVGEMCEAVEKYAKEKAQQAAKQAAKSMAKRLFENGVSYEIVQKSITELTRKELERVYRKTAVL